MPVHNADIAAIFEEIADLLEVQDANRFRVRAYRNAARELQGLGVALTELIDKGENLTDLPSIGDDLAGKIKEIVKTGHSRLLDRARRQTPPSIRQLLKIRGLGPKRVAALYRELDVQTVEQLARAAQDGRIRELHGFGVKSEQAILEAVRTHVGAEKRFKLAVAAQYAEPLRKYLQGIPGVDQVVIAGSYRRCQETVGDLDILVTATEARQVMERFVSYEETADVVETGSTRSTVLLASGLQVDLRVVDRKAFGSALLYFTGSKAHNIEIRRRAQERGLKISEYGVYQGKRRIAGATEKSVYRAVDLPWIPPELRENHGEIEAAEVGKLPDLIELSDLKGDLHAHTRTTDGHNTLREMAEAARSRGFRYLAITEYSRSGSDADGLTPQRLRRQMREIDKLNREFKGFRLLKGIEVEILEDGRLDLPDEVLAECDLVVGAVHSGFQLSRAKQTRRILRAMEHPAFTILAHPTGRLIDQREPFDVDMLQVIRKARECGCFLELNVHPDRLDLLDVYCQMAREEGVLVAISADAHSLRDFNRLIYGIGQARRGWLEKDDVLNTRPLRLLRALLKRGK